MKIAIFTDTFLPQTNGVVNAVLQSARKLSVLGHEVVIFAPTDSERGGTKESRGFRVEMLPSVPAFVYPGERMVLPARRAFRALEAMQPDIIHSHTPFGAGKLAVRGARSLGVPLVGTHHTFYDHYLKYIKLNYSWMRGIIWKLTINYYNDCSFMISPSGALAETLKDVGLASPVGVVPNAIDTDFFRPIENDSEKENAKRHFGINGFSIAYMGRLGYEKSIDVVIRAFAYMKKEMPDLTLMIIGDGPERRHLEQLVRELGLTDSVVFTGFQYGEDLVRALHANDVFVTASKSENMPLSVLEAMAVGLPVISVREKGLAEIVKEGENGLFSKTDDEQDIATKTLSILSRPDTMREYGVASRKLALQYSEDVAVEALLDAYNRALKNQT